MAEEKRRDLETLNELGPGQVFMPFLVMEDLLDKIKLLQIDNETINSLKFKPLNRHYFALQSNPGEQFFIFVNLAAWLIKKCGHYIEAPQEMDDPNATISSILEILRKMNVTINFPPSRLKSGYGSEVLFVLDRLADHALKHTDFSWNKPLHDDEDKEEDTQENDSELVVEKVEEEMEEAEEESDDDEDESTYLNFEILSKPTSRQELSSQQQLEGSSRPDDILESKVDSTEWRLEVERVLPQLKVTIHADNKDWRSHLEQMHHHRREMEASLGETKNQLDRLYADMSRTLEKISSRERYLNQQLEGPLSELRTAQARLSAAKDRYRTVSRGVMDRSRTLAQLSDELDQVKQEMEEKGSSMTDGTPLVNIRKALSQLKMEINQMNVRIGVANHTLLQAKFKEKGNLQRAATTPSVPNMDAVF